MSQKEQHYEKALKDIYGLCQRCDGGSLSQTVVQTMRTIESALKPDDVDELTKAAFKWGLMATVKLIRQAAKYTGQRARHETDLGDKDLGLSMQDAADNYRAMADRVQDHINDPAKLLDMMQEKP